MKIGTYRLGHELVDLYGDEADTGGYFNLMTDNGYGRITIGLGYCCMSEVLKVLLHETMEYLMTRAGVRFHSCGKTSDDAADYKFFFDHAQFSELCARQAVFIDACLVDLQKAFEQLNADEQPEKGLKVET